MIGLAITDAPWVALRQENLVDSKKVYIVFGARNYTAPGVFQSSSTSLLARETFPGWTSVSEDQFTAGGPMGRQGPGGLLL